MEKHSHLYAIKPLTWELDDTHWPTLADVPMVFIDQYALPSTGPIDLGALAGTRLYLFGGPIRHDANSYHVEYKLIERRLSGELTVHHLAHRGGSVAFESCVAAEDSCARSRQPDMKDQERWKFGSSVAATAMKAVRVFYQYCDYEDALWNQYVQAGKPKGLNQWLRSCIDRDFRWLSRKPRWISSEGHWPTFRGKPMLFIAQTAQRENDTTRKRIFGNIMLYLFAAGDEPQAEFKIHLDLMGEQSAEQHYALEEMMGDFMADPTNVDLIRRCIKKGGRYMQEFMLEQRTLSETALRLLSTEGANKEIRDMAAKRLAAEGTS